MWDDLEKDDTYVLALASDKKRKSQNIKWAMGTSLVIIIMVALMLAMSIWWI